MENCSEIVKWACSFNRYLRVPPKADFGKLSISKLPILLMRTTAAYFRQARPAFAILMSKVILGPDCVKLLGKDWL